MFTNIFSKMDAKPVSKSFKQIQDKKDEFTPLPLYSEKFQNIETTNKFLKSSSSEDHTEEYIENDCYLKISLDSKNKETTPNKDTENNKNITNEIIVLLQETETMHLFEIPSTTVLGDTDEGKLVGEDNAKYDYLTIGKGKNRKMESAETQTVETILITNQTLAPNADTTNSYAFASAWDMYDSYAEVKESNSDENKKEDNFYNAMIMMERVLVNNVYRKQQEYYKGISKLTVNDSEQFNMILLWQFYYEEIKETPALSLSINPINTDILAVGYGKYKYSSTKTGIICIWSIKNPKQPERCYHFENSVTSVAFSTCNPNLLAVGFYNGDIIILDITNKNKSIYDRSTRETSPCYEPIWVVQWYKIDETESEKIISLCQDGRINSFGQPNNEKFICSSLMKITKVEKINDNTKKQDPQSEIPMNRNLPCTVFCRHPDLSIIYYVGTGYGNIYKCSFTNSKQYLSFLKAHDGPVYSIHFSSYCKRILLTSGADWTVKIWIEGVSTPLITLMTSLNPVMAATFCPIVSTLVAAISGTELFIWDLQRNNDFLLHRSSLSEHTLTTLTFTKDGNSMFISDTRGAVYVYNLVNLPKTSDNQEESLKDSIHRHLIIKPNLLKKFIKYIDKPLT